MQREVLFTRDFEFDTNKVILLPNTIQTIYK